MSTQPDFIFADGRGPDLCVVGGLGHVGLPLAIVFADSGLNVLIHDINAAGMQEVRAGRVPFMESGAEDMLRAVLDQGRLAMTTDLAALAAAPILVVTIGTPIDEFHNPDYGLFRRWVEEAAPRLRPGQLLVLRSTVYPGTSDWLTRRLGELGAAAQVAFCPERIVQGKAVEELRKLPQIVSGSSAEALARASALFGRIAPSIVEMSPKEAEFAKLFANAYRYIQFAVANQFYMLAHAAGVDFHRVHAGMKRDYPRLADLPGAGFAAGPCLFKDTMQLAAFSQNQFALGHAATQINEGLVLFIVERVLAGFPLCDSTVGLLGMAFKADNDDIRSSLSYKLKKILEIRARRVVATDPFVTVDPSLLPVEDVVAQSDLLILCAPHSRYRGLDLKGRPVVDIWGFFDPAKTNRIGVAGPVC